MPSATVKDTIRGAYQRLSENIPNFRHRQSQKQMIADVSNTLDAEKSIRIAVIEGQTGTGKSIGYMLGAIPAAMEQKKSLIISTATVALQEQLVNKDLPLVAEKAGLEFTYQIAKGRRRYMCPRNVDQLAGSNTDQDALDLGQGHEEFAAWPRPPKEGEMELVTRMNQQFSAEQWSGDIDFWGENVDGDTRAVITTNNAGCSGRDCPWINRCPFHVARRDLKEADVVIANHDLVLADMQMGGGVILPDPAESVYVFDEAHHLPDKAVGHFAFQSEIKSSISALDSMRKTAKRMVAVIDDVKAADHHRTIEAELPELKRALTSIRRMIEESFPAPAKTRFTRDSDNQVWRFEHGVTPEGFMETGKEVANRAARIIQAGTEIHAIVKKAVRNGDLSNRVSDKLIQDMGFAIERCDSITVTWMQWARADEPGHVPMARWVERSAQGDDVVVAVSAISAASMLKAMLWERAYGVILTSATITALNTFDRFRRASGLRDDDGTLFTRLESPFNYPEQGEVHIPWLGVEPGDAEAHTDAVIEFIAQNAHQHISTLVLFSSGFQMRQVGRMLPKAIRERCLIQNDLPKHEILEEHERRIENGEQSIIFGLASFAEGVDLPGDLCRHVIIAKLPFAVPDTPVDAARAEWITTLNRNPFIEITVPDASLKLVQAVGRLIRSETDTGVVTILDQRMITKRYGAQLLDALPPLRRNVARPPALAHTA